MGCTKIIRVAINCNSGKFIEWIINTIPQKFEYITLNGETYVVRVTYTPKDDYTFDNLYFNAIHADKASFDYDLLTEEDWITFDDRFPHDELLGVWEIIDADQNNFEMRFMVMEKPLNNIIDRTLIDAKAHWKVTVLEEIGISQFNERINGGEEITPKSECEIRVPEQETSLNITNINEGKNINIPKKIYSKDLDQYTWLIDVENAKMYYKDYSIMTMEAIIRDFAKAFSNYNDFGGTWGPNKIAKLVNKNPTVVGRYLKVLRNWGIETIDDITLPIKHKK